MRILKSRRLPTPVINGYLFGRNRVREENDVNSRYAHKLTNGNTSASDTSLCGREIRRRLSSDDFDDYTLYENGSRDRCRTETLDFFRVGARRCSRVILAPFSRAEKRAADT